MNYNELYAWLWWKFSSVCFGLLQQQQQQQHCVNNKFMSQHFSMHMLAEIK